MPAKYLVVEPRGRVALVTIKHPPRNFLRTGMLYELNDLLDAFERDGVRSVVITGGLKDYFIAHADLELVRAAEPSHPKAYQSLRFWHRTLGRLQSCSQVIIAAINGQALGGGCEFALACDFRFMARGPRKIGLIEVQLGIIPGAGGTQRMARLLGRGRALELILEGKALTADAAERVGLVHRAVDPDRLLPESLAYAEKLARWSPVAVRNIKRAIHEGLEMPLAQGLELETACFYETMTTEVAKETLDAGIRAYREGREPAFE
jgi:enoyl-CoA hydratase